MADHGVMGRSAGPGARAMRSWCSQCAGIAAPRASRALVGLRRSMRSERDTRRRGRDASETGAVDKRVRSARARRSEPAIRRDRREASEPCRSAHTRSHRHGAMRSGSAGDATASPRPPASRADAAVETPAEPRRSMRSERDTRRRGRDASEPCRSVSNDDRQSHRPRRSALVIAFSDDRKASEAMRRSDRSIPAPARRSRQWQCDGIALPRASRADAASDTPGEPRGSMRSKRDTRRRGRDASEIGVAGHRARSARRCVANRRSKGIVVKRARRADRYPPTPPVASAEA